MNNPKQLIVLLAVATLTAGCNAHQEDHGHTHDAEQVQHADHGHPKDAAEPAPHDDHGHGSGIAVTHFTDKTELFVEYAPLAKGQESPFAAHLTFLNPQGFRAVAEGKLIVTLTGGGFPDEQAETGVSDTPGIFRPVLKPQHVGQRQLKMRLELPDSVVTHDLGKVTVYPNHKAAEASIPTEEEDTAIGFTKEQQWKIPFATELVAERTVRASVSATATLRPSANREAIIAAPSAGLLRAGAGGFPQIGDTVKAGQVLAYLAPKLGGEADVATLRLEVDRARIATEQARVDRERLEGLLKLEAIPEKRLRDAAAREKLAQAELSAAQQRIATFSGVGGGIALKSPVAGQIVAVAATPGGAVMDGQSIMHVADLKRLWLEARIAESDVTRITQPDGVSFNLGDNSTVTIEVGRNGRLVAFGGLVDPTTRTVPAIFEFDNPDGRLRAGMNLQADIYTGQKTQGVAVPTSAVIDDGGMPVVFVLREGESFERRVIITGSRDGDWIAIKSGLQAGERVVTLGAYQLRLAATAPAAIGHGHAH